MDVQALAQQLVTFLSPFLPYLLKAGEKAIEKVGEKFGEAAWEKAQALWDKLHPKIEAKPAAQEAAADVAQNPQDEDAQAALRLQLKKLLAEDTALAEEVARLLAGVDAGRGNTVIASGNRSVAIGGSVSGSTIITGDKNKLNR